MAIFRYAGITDELNLVVTERTMSLPIVAVIGRPNVGKSTLVNRIAGSQEAIVYDQPGMTRDRTYRPAFWQDREFLIVDTGGLVFDDDTEFLPQIRQQAMTAMSESQAVIFVVDGQTGPTAGDAEIAQWLRQQTLPVLLAVNKCESVTQGLTQAAQFWELGLGEPYPISAGHGTGVGDLLDALVPHLPLVQDQDNPTAIQVAIVGRPNVGKSSLLNALVGSERAIVSPIAGTTRDSVDTLLTRDGQTYRLIDTAGIRRKKYVDYGPEFFSINRAFKAIRRADVVLLVLDVTEGVTDQDLKLADRIVEEGRACVLVANKWDAVSKDSHTLPQVERQLRSRLYFLDWADLIFVSAKTGQRVDKILTLVQSAAESHRRRVTTAVINEVLAEATAWQSPPATRQGRQGRIYYGTQVQSQPPTIALFVNDPKLFKDNYRRYLDHQFREHLGFRGTPVH
ncbi:MAG: ribosome biogenesis GTPase Der, partial [Gloeomargarita sp. HHBFW_bins_162]